MGMTDSRSARRTPILSAPANPAQSTLNRDPAQSQTQSQPEAPESITQHQQEEHCKEIMVGLRVGQGGTSPGPKETAKNGKDSQKWQIAYRQTTSILRTKHVRAFQPIVALRQHAHNTWRHTEDKSTL